MKEGPSCPRAVGAPPSGQCLMHSGSASPSSCPPPEESLTLDHVAPALLFGQ